MPANAPPPRRAYPLGAALFCVVCLSAATPAHADRMVLWKIVHGQCVPNMEAGKGSAPCTDVDIAKGEDQGVALLKDLRGVAQQLAIPTRQVTGIEDPLLLAPDAPDYFAYAWRERTKVEALLNGPLPREAIGVEINSIHARSQDQLHLHVDCMNVDVVSDLEGYQDALDQTFRPMTIALMGRKYWGRRASPGELAAKTPFRMLAEGIEGAREQMGVWSLLLVGATFKGEPGFVLLADHAEMLGGGYAEDLLDHECAIAARR